MYQSVFESALITRAGVERQVDLGLLAETIFFYRSVQLVLNGSSVSALAKLVPADDLISLLARSEIKLSYVRPNFGVVSTGALRGQDFGAFTFSGSKRQPTLGAQINSLKVHIAPSSLMRSEHYRKRLLKKARKSLTPAAGRCRSAAPGR